MTSKSKTRDVQKSLYLNFLKKAQECYNAALHAFEDQGWNALAVNTVHCCISACDAMCVYFLGRRSSSENHNDAIKLLKAIKIKSEDLNANTNRLLNILRIKNMVEYEERLIYRSEAEKILKDCQRFLEYVKRNLPKEQ